MSTFHLAIYAGLGLSLVAIGLWRFGSGRKVFSVGLVLGIAILAVIASSFVGLVSLDDVESCLAQKGGGRSKLLICLAQMKVTSKQPGVGS